MIHFSFLFCIEDGDKYFYNQLALQDGQNNMATSSGQIWSKCKSWQGGVGRSEARCATPPCRTRYACVCVCVDCRFDYKGGWKKSEEGQFYLAFLSSAGDGD